MSTKASRKAMGLSNNFMTIETLLNPVNGHQTPPTSPKRKLSISEQAVSTSQRRKTEPNTPSIQQEDEDAYAAATILYNAAMGIIAANPASPSDSELSDEEEDAIATRDIQQKPLKTGESFAPHPNEPNKIIATFCVPELDGSAEYIQVDEILECLTTPQPNGNTDNGDVYFSPPLSLSKCPRRLRGSKGSGPILWTPHPTIPYTWTRTKGSKTETFTLCILFRRFNSSTHAYEHAYYNSKLLATADPNDRTWMYSFNKWLDQITRRRDQAYVAAVQRTHWTGRELRALYTGINDFVRRKGVPAFGFGEGTAFKTGDMQAIADQVNAVGTNERGVDAVRGKVISAHQKKNKAIADLRDRAAEMRKMIAEGEEVGDEVRFPEHAIELEEFPTEAEASLLKLKAKKRKTGKKDKGRVAIKEESDDEGDGRTTASDYEAPVVQKGASRKRKRAIAPEKSDEDDKGDVEADDKDEVGIDPEDKHEELEDSGIAMSDSSSELSSV